VYNATTGAVINAALVPGIPDSLGIAFYGGDLYVTTQSSVPVAVYDASTGAVVNAALVTSIPEAAGIAIASVPEPSSFILLALTGAAVFCCFRLTRRKEVLESSASGC
jgi:hypothetical protein